MHTSFFYLILSFSIRYICDFRQVGDGTTSVVLLSSEILKECKQFIEEGVHSQIVARGIRKATALSLERIKEIAVKISFVFLHP